MKNLLLAAILASPAGCTATERGAAIGGASGAAIGAAVSGDVGGAVVGGAAGAVAGALIGNAQEPGKCYYRNRYGQRYIANCP
ncbi:outer membrane protein with glycine zipper [Hoeflea marina]|uniref:Outer membrane protein with glycine zipper n=1 Tax=Hoeflea marina TaxID=274592 RepID=A0A317PMI6_9HYPH|nr:glycine zipper domain-containing protein [Hoeflea marina]PWW01479.1 outer membrane protein with glycine zipper [Hoeflea marina]